MKFIDTHCHLYSKEFDDDIDQVVERAIGAGVEKLYLPAIDSSTLDAMIATEKKFPDTCISMIGLHPCSVKENFMDELKIAEHLLQKRKFAAVGEIGLDFYWDKSFAKNQSTAFHMQIEWAMHYDIPIVIHSRESMEQCIDIVKEHQNGKLKGIFHCFSGDIEAAKKIIDLGFYLGIGGVVTYKKSLLPEVLKEVDLKHVVLETDAPYLPPVPFRGKRNESSFLIYVAKKIAELKNIDLGEVALITTGNAEKIFGN